MNHATPQQQQQAQNLQQSAMPDDGGDRTTKQSGNEGVFGPLADSSLNDFSWRDLGAVSQFITNDFGVTDHLFSSPDTGFDIAAGMPMTSSSVGGAGELAEDWYDFSMGNDVIF
jgi:hypothetical protein